MKIKNVAAAAIGGLFFFGASQALAVTTLGT
jgi:hypothetical protein